MYINLLKLDKEKLDDQLVAWNRMVVKKTHKWYYNIISLQSPHTLLVHLIIRFVTNPSPLSPLAFDRTQQQGRHLLAPRAATGLHATNNRNMN